MTTTAEVTAEFIKAFERINDDCPDDDDTATKSDTKSETKKRARTPIEELSADDAVNISLATMDYYMTRYPEDLCAEIDCATDFARSIYAEAKAFKVQYGDLFDVGDAVKAIEKAKSSDDW